MKNLTIIVPVIDMAKETNQELLKRAISSVDDSQIIIVGQASDIEIIEKIELPKIVRVLINKSENTSYPYQVNLGVNEVKTSHFCVLEYDDEFTPIWFNNVETYLNNETEDVFAYLPLTEVIDLNVGPVGYSNEAVWASSFSENLGFYDLQCLEDYVDFNTSGTVFRTQDFITLGLLKSSMKVSFWYEFLLRAAYKSKKMFVIPKVGYKHYIGREDSLSYFYGNNMSETEVNWWINLAKKEYFFPHDRNKTYQE